MFSKYVLMNVISSPDVNAFWVTIGKIIKINNLVINLQHPSLVLIDFQPNERLYRNQTRSDIVASVRLIYSCPVPGAVKNEDDTKPFWVLTLNSEEAFAFRNLIDSLRPPDLCPSTPPDLYDYGSACNSNFLDI